MRYPLIIIVIFSLIILSCTHNNNALKYSVRDTVLKEHLLQLDSLPYYDTTEINYKVLKAYQNNDTVFLKSLSVLIKNEKKYKSYWASQDSCIHQQKLEALGADEAYRFTYLSAFCRMPINITLTKKRDTFNLHFLLYQTKYDTAACRIIAEYDKKMTAKEWTEFSNKLEAADIWGLKRDNGIHGFDGSTIIFTGYQKGDVSFNRPDKTCYVSRWELSTLQDAFTFILKISKNKKGCFYIM